MLAPNRCLGQGVTGCPVEADDGLLLWERAVPVIFRGHELGVPARSYRKCAVASATTHLPKRVAQNNLANSAVTAVSTRKIRSPSCTGCKPDSASFSTS